MSGEMVGWALRGDVVVERLATPIPVPHKKRSGEITTYFVAASTAQHVLMCLAEAANADGTNAFPSVARISRESRLSERTVRKALRALESVELIRPAGLRRTGTVNYSLAFAGELRPGGNDVPGGSGEPKGGNDTTPTPELCSPEPSGNRSEPVINGDLPSPAGRAVAPARPDGEAAGQSPIDDERVRTASAVREVLQNGIDGLPDGQQGTTPTVRAITAALEEFPVSHDHAVAVASETRAKVQEDGQALNVVSLFRLKLGDQGRPPGRRPVDPVGAEDARILEAARFERMADAMFPAPPPIAYTDTTAEEIEPEPEPEPPALLPEPDDDEPDLSPEEVRALIASSPIGKRNNGILDEVVS